jgi:signal transduction histidine kinase
MSHSGMMLLSGIEWAMKKGLEKITNAQRAYEIACTKTTQQTLMESHRIFVIALRSLQNMICVDEYNTLTNTDIHDINNAFTALIGNLDLACNPIFGDPETINQNMLRVIAACTRTIIQIIHIRMGLCENVHDDVRMCDMVDIAVEIAKSSRRQWLNIVHIYTDIDPACDVVVEKNRDTIVRVFMNAICNALDATDITRDQSIIWINIQPSDVGLAIEIMDNGRGIPMNIREKIFDEHFSTKGACGSGLGLYYCKKAIEHKCNGSISIGHNGIGTSMYLTIPYSALTH